MKCSPLLEEEYPRQSVNLTGSLLVGTVYEDTRRKDESKDERQMEGN
jgi:hypothetical protein